MSRTTRATTDTASAALALPAPKERRRLREALALSEEQVAEAMGVTRATVRSWETGRTDPRGRKREAYVKLLGAYEEQSAPSATAPAPSTEAPEPPQASTSATPRPDPRPETASASTRPTTPAKRAPKPPKAKPSKTPSVDREAAAQEPREPQVPQEPRERLKPAAQVAPEPETAAKRPQEPVLGSGPELVPVPELTPEQAFDALYAHAAPGLVHQTYLLTGRRRLSRESVEHAFHHAWQHWPEVAVDRDPVGWVRAVAYEYALSPWHRLRRSHRHPDAPPTEARRRALLAALLELPPPYRRTVLLYDGLGLGLPETAAETEASTPAAANRLLHARTVIGMRIPELADPDALHGRLVALVDEAPTATLATARAVRTRSEWRTRFWTRSTLALTAVLIGATAFTAATAPTQYLPVHAPGETVNGVPVRGGSQPLTEEDRELRDSLRSHPHRGPERLIPDPH